MKTKKFSRFLASLLAVLMLASATGMSPAVFAEGFGEVATAAETQYEAPQLRSGTAVIPAGSDVATVKTLLAKALIANYDKCDPTTRDNIEWEYECEGKSVVAKNTGWGSIAGFTSSTKTLGITTTYTHPALAANDDGNYQVRIKGSKGEVTLTKAAKLSSSISAQDVKLSMPYTEEGNIDFNKLRADIFEAAVTATNPNLSVNDVSFEYYATSKASFGHDWVGFEGSALFPEINVGTQKVKVFWNGNDSYFGSSADFTVELVGREQAEIALRSNVEVALTYKADGSIDYADIEAFVLAAAVESSTPTLTVNNTEITYYATANTGSLGSVGKAWVPLNGSGGYPGVSAGNSYDVKLSFKGDDAYLPKTVQLSISFVDARNQASISFNENPTVKIPYTEDIKIDFAALRTAIWNNIVSETTPAGLTADDVTIMYQVKTLTGHDWEKLEGSLIHSAISEGLQKLQITYAGNAEYKGFVKEVDVQFVGREEAPFEFNSEVTELGLVYNKDSSINYEATAQRIREALVTATGDLSIDGITVEYNNVLDGIPHFVSLDNETNKLNLFGLGQFTIRLSWDGNREYKAWEQKISINFVDNRIKSVVEIRSDAAITYNMDANVMLQAIFDNAIDWTNSTLPAKETLTIDDFVITYYAEAQIKSGTAIGDDLLKKLSPYMHKWVSIEGEENTILEIGVIYPKMGAGEQQIRIQYVGNEEYRPSTEAEGNLTVKKADVKVKVHSTSIYPNEVPGDDFVTLNPNDPAIDVYVIYGGITSNLSGSIYLQLPSTNPNLVNAINKALEYMGKPPLQEGITVGELKAILNEIINFGGENSLMQKAIELILKQYGIDYGTLKNIINALNKLPSLSDNVRIVIGFPPNHAGLYLAIAVTDNENYNTAIGTGLLTVKMRVAGMKIQLNDNLTRKLTVDQAKALAADPNGIASLLYNGEAVKNPNLHFLYSGVQSNFRPYSSTTEFPTVPGRYVVTVVTLGGDYMAAPVTFSFQITK